MTMFIETSDNRLFSVKDAGPDMPHAWLGTELSRRTLQPRKNAREMLVRKAGCRLVYQEREQTIEQLFIRIS